MKWRIYIDIYIYICHWGHPFFWGCFSGGVYVLCIYSHDRWATAGNNSGLCCCVCVTAFECKLTPLCVDSFLFSTQCCLTESELFETLPPNFFWALDIHISFGDSSAWLFFRVAEVWRIKKREHIFLIFMVSWACALCVCCWVITKHFLFFVFF